MTDEELIQKLNDEVKAKINAQNEIERFKKEIARLQANLEQAEYFVKKQDKIINDVIESLRSKGE